MAEAYTTSPNMPSSLLVFNGKLGHHSTTHSYNNIYMYYNFVEFFIYMQTAYAKHTPNHIKQLPWEHSILNYIIYTYIYLFIIILLSTKTKYIIWYVI